MFKKLYTEIKKAKSIVIFRHSNPDGDAFGSANGLAEIIKENFKEKKVLVGGEETNDFTDKFFPSPENISQEIIDNSLVIITDTANTERIDGPRENLENSIKIDHHPNNEPYGKLFVGDDSYASASEIIVEFAIENELEIPKKAAEYLYVGMVTDTGRFQYNSTNKRTMHMAGELLEVGVNVNRIFSKMYNKSINQIRFNAAIQSKIKLEGNVAHVILPSGLSKKFDIHYSQASSSVYLLIGASEVKYALFASKDPKTGKYRISLRSKAKPINKIAEQFGGGGHEMASGIKLDSKKQIKEVLEKLKEL